MWSRRLLSANTLLKLNNNNNNLPKFPLYGTLRSLSKILKVNPEKLLKHVGFKLNKRVYCGYEDENSQGSHILMWDKDDVCSTRKNLNYYEFNNIGDVIVPYHVSKQIAEHYKQQLVFRDTEPKISWEKAVERLRKRKTGVTMEEIRSPVVVLLGHFNHGKTTLLDTLIGKGSKIASREAHGITQEIRACSVKLESSVKTTMIDTPGQDIFYGMRSGGAEVADMAILVISAIDGVCQQTEECIGCLQDLKIPAVVVINKIDLVQSEDIQALLEDIREYDGFEDIPIIPISALTGQGIDQLQENMVEIFKSLNVMPLDILKSIEGHGTVLDLVSNSSGQHFLLLMNTGSISTGDYFVCGLMQGRIRSLHDPLTFATIKEALPGQAVRVQCTGINRKTDIPLGQPFYLLNKKQAEAASISRNLEAMIKDRKIDQLPKTGITDSFFGVDECASESSDDNEEEDDDTEEVKGLISKLRPQEDEDVPSDVEDELGAVVYKKVDRNTYAVIKANMGNTLATLVDAMEDLKKEGEVVLVARQGVGTVGVGDIQIAKAAKCPIFAYDVSVDVRAKKLAKKENVKIVSSKTVQGLIDHIRQWGQQHQLQYNKQQ